MTAKVSAKQIQRKAAFLFDGVSRLAASVAAFYVLARVVKRINADGLVTVCEFGTVACRFNGVQQFPGRKPIELWTVVENRGLGNFLDDGIFRGGTFSAETLRQARLIPVAVIA